MNQDAWIRWIGAALILLVLGGIILAILGSYWGDPDLSAHGTDLLKVMVGLLMGLLGGRVAGGRQSSPRGSRTNGKEEKN
jgi:hypothetical protein